MKEEFYKYFLYFYVNLLDIEKKIENFNNLKRHQLECLNCTSFEIIYKNKILKYWMLRGINQKFYCSNFRSRSNCIII